MGIWLKLGGAGAAITIAFSAGCQVENWRLNGKHHKAESDRLSGVIAVQNQQIADKDQSLLDEAERLQREQKARARSEEALADAYAANAQLAASRASTSTRIIERGQEIGNELVSTNPCIRAVWPGELRDFANGSDYNAAMSPFAAGRDSNGEQSALSGRAGTSRAAER